MARLEDGKSPIAAAVRADRALEASARGELADGGGGVTEYTLSLRNGSVHVFGDRYAMESQYPSAARAEAARREGLTVYRRRILVLEDWAVDGGSDGG